MIDTTENNLKEVEENSNSSEGTQKTNSKKTTRRAKTKTEATKTKDTSSKSTVKKAASDKVATSTKKTTAKSASTKTSETRVAKAKTTSSKAGETKVAKVKTTSSKAGETRGDKAKETSAKTSGNKETKIKKTSDKAGEDKDVKTKTTVNKKTSTKKSVPTKSTNSKVNLEKKNKAIEDVKEDVITENLIEGNEYKPEKIIEDESKYDTISLEEIREAIENRVDNKQKKSVIKEILVNLGIAIIMVLYLILIMMGCRNLTLETLDKDIKIITLMILLIGIVILEVSYKKDNFKTAMHGIEVLVFGAANLCLIYIAKLYFNNLIKFLGYIGLAVAGYYVVKTIILSITSIKRFKKDNNDIKDIVQKKNKIEEEN